MQAEVAQVLQKNNLQSVGFGCVMSETENCVERSYAREWYASIFHFWALQVR